MKDSLKKSKTSSPKKHRFKVVLVWFIHNRKCYFFGSISSIFRKFSEDELGCTYETLRHRLRGDNSSHITSRAYFYSDRLIRGASTDV